MAERLRTTPRNSTSRNSTSRNSTTRNSASLLDIEHPVDIRIAQLNDVYNASWVICSAFNVLNTKHGYTELTIEPTRGGRDKNIEQLARKLAASVKHKNKIIYVLVAPVACSSPRASPRSTKSTDSISLKSPGRKISNSNLTGITVVPSKKVPSSTPSRSSPSPIMPPLKKVPSNQFTRSSSISPRERALSARLDSVVSPFKRGRGLSISGRQHGTSLSFDGSRRRPSFTPPVKIEGKQGYHKQKVVGVVVLDKRDAVFGLGPLSIHPHFSGQGFGRRLMQTVIEDWHDCKSDTFGQSVRLLVEAYNAPALSLFVKTEFQIRESFIAVSGNINIEILPKNYSVIPLTKEKIELTKKNEQTDLLELCGKIMDKIFGYRRMNELKEAIDDPTCYPFVVLKQKGNKTQIVGYTSTLNVSGHSCALSMGDLKALIVGVDLYYSSNHVEKKSEESSKELIKPIQPTKNVSKELMKPLQTTKTMSKEFSKAPPPPPTEISFLISGQSQPELFAWCLNGGFRVAKQLTLLSHGQYEAPSTPNYFPSILY